MAEENPTDILRREHDKVLKILDKLESELRNQDVKSPEETIAVLEREFQAHSLNKEEKALFPEIEKFIPREAGPTGIMIMEHEDLVKSINDFKNAVKTKDSSKMSAVGDHIIDLLRQHIDKENNILFFMADMHLDDKQKKIILEKFKGIDSKH